MYYQNMMLQSTCQLEVFSSAPNLDLIKNQSFSGKIKSENWFE